MTGTLTSYSPGRPCPAFEGMLGDVVGAGWGEAAGRGGNLGEETLSVRTGRRCLQGGPTSRRAPGTSRLSGRGWAELLARRAEKGLGQSSTESAAPGQPAQAGFPRGQPGLLSASQQRDPG